MGKFQEIKSVPSQTHAGVEIMMQYDPSSNEISFWQHNEMEKISKRVGKTYQYRPNYDWFYDDKLMEIFTKTEVKNRLVW